MFQKGFCVDDNGLISFGQKKFFFKMLFLHSLICKDIVLQYDIRKFEKQKTV